MHLKDPSSPAKKKLKLGEDETVSAGDKSAKVLTDEECVENTAERKESEQETQPDNKEVDEQPVVEAKAQEVVKEDIEVKDSVIDDAGDTSDKAGQK